MLNIVELIDYLFSNNYYDFFKILNKYLMNNNELFEILENIKWHYLFDDIEIARKDSIKLIQLIHLNNK